MKIKHIDYSKKRFLKGFTLVELLVVISVIGLLMGFGMAKYSTAEKQARDTQRQSDLNQYRVALENYAAAKSSLYPPLTSCVSVSSACPGPNCGLCNYGTPTFATSYLSGSCIQDPRYDRDPTTYYYRYCSADGSQYILWAKLEGEGYYEICSNGKSGKTAVGVTPTDSTCDL